MWLTTLLSTFYAMGSFLAAMWVTVFSKCSNTGGYLYASTYNLIRDLATVIIINYIFASRQRVALLTKSWFLHLSSQFAPLYNIFARLGTNLSWQRRQSPSENPLLLHIFLLSHQPFYSTVYRLSHWQQVNSIISTPKCQDLIIR